MIVDASGNVYVTGGSHGVGSNFDFATIKYSSAGIQQWVQRYNGPGNSSDHAERIAIDGSGNVYVTGLSNGSGTGNDYATIKYNSSGVQQWLQRYDGPASGSDDPLGIVTDNQGNVYVTGGSPGVGSSYDFATIKYNAAGQQQWIQRYNGPGNGFDRAYSIAIDGLGNVYVTGESYGFGCLTLKYSPSGLQQWLQAYVGTANGGTGFDIKVDGSGSVYVTGFGSNIGTGLDYATIKYVPTPYIVFLALPLDNSVVPLNLGLSWHIVLGASSYQLQVYTDSLLNNILYNFQGLTDTSKFIEGLNYSTPYWWRARAMMLSGPGPWSEVWKFTTEDLTGIKNENSEIPKEYKLYTNYPNPFNPATKIKFAVPKSSFVKLSLYDLTGKEVYTLANEVLNAGIYNFNFNATSMSSGVYFYKLIADGFTDTKRMVLIK